MSTEAGRPPLQLRDYVRVLRRRAWVIVAATAATAIVALAGSLVQTPVYQANTDILIETRPSTQVFDNGNTQIVDQARAVQTEQSVLASAAVQDAATKKLGHKPDVSVNPTDGSNVVGLTASSTDRNRAAVDANTYAQTYISFRQQQTVNDLVQAGTQLKAKISDLDAQLARLLDPAQRTALVDQRNFLSQQLDRVQVTSNLPQTSGALVLAKATVPSNPSSPRTLRNGLIGAALGLFLGIGLAFLLEYFDDTIKRKEDLEEISPTLPVLGEIPVVREWRQRADPVVVSTADARSPAAEAYRSLRTSVQFLGVDRDLKSIQVTSARADEGKTTTIANLGVALARAGQNVVIVGCDLRRPRLHDFFGISNAVGFTSVLLGEVPLRHAIGAVPGEDRLAILPAGPPPPNPSELLASVRAREILDELTRLADVVLIDSPPLLPVSDGLVLAGLADATIVVVQAGSSSRRVLQRALEMLRSVDRPAVGAVLNMVRTGASGYDYSYSYGYGENYERPPTRPQSRPRPRPRGNGHSDTRDERTLPDVGRPSPT